MSHYQRYIGKFAEIAIPLHNLTQKVSFCVNRSMCCNIYYIAMQTNTGSNFSVPQFTVGANPFVIQTDTSAVRLGAALEQNNQVIAYASQSQNPTMVPSKENAGKLFLPLKQYCHYLLGCLFILMTDHAPLQWLSAQKMEALPCRWALALQEYAFTIVHRKRTLMAMQLHYHATHTQLQSHYQLLSPLPLNAQLLYDIYQISMIS